MPKSEVHICQCSHCQQESVHAYKELHRQMNLLLSRLGEQQRRWYVAAESNRMGAGGDRLLSQITGLDAQDHPAWTARSGTVYVGSSADTPEFAVAALARWWEDEGHIAYPDAKGILILADSGGSQQMSPRKPSQTKFLSLLPL